MTVPEWFKPSAFGALGGAAVLAVAGFTWGGWVTSSTAHGMAVTAAKTQVTAALVPVCLAASKRDPERGAKLEAIKAESTYRGKQLVMDAGWATPPGYDSPNRDVAKSCAAALVRDSSSN